MQYTKQLSVCLRLLRLTNFKLFKLLLSLRQFLQ